MAKIRFAFRLCCIAICLLYGMAEMFFLFPFYSKKRKLRAIQIWSLRVLASCGMKLKTYGNPPSEEHGQMLICNHISWLDIMAVNAAFPGRFVAKDDVAKWPVIGYLATQAQTVYVARNKGTEGNIIRILADCTAAGITTAVTAMAGGAANPDIQPALTAVIAEGHDIIACGISDEANLIKLRAHLEKVGAPTEKRWAVGVYGDSGTLATATTLAGKLNNGFMLCAWYRGTPSLPCELAAAFASVMASEEDPARPLNTLALEGIGLCDSKDKTMRTEQENALYNGVAPVETSPDGSRAQIVRAITTYTKPANGTADGQTATGGDGVADVVFTAYRITNLDLTTQSAWDGLQSTQVPADACGADFQTPSLGSYTFDGGKASAATANSSSQPSFGQPRRTVGVCGAGAAASVAPKAAGPDDAGRPACGGSVLWLALLPADVVSSFSLMPFSLLRRAPACSCLHVRWWSRPRPWATRWPDHAAAGGSAVRSRPSRPA